MKEIKNDLLVKIQSVTGGRVVVILPEQRIRRFWEKKGAIKTMKMEYLREGIYDPGFEYMLTQGILDILDSGEYKALDIKKALGLEPEEVEEPVNTVVLTEGQMVKLLKISPLDEFKKTLKTLKYEQVVELANLAIEKEVLDMDKNAIIEEICDINVLKAVNLNRDVKKAEEAQKEKK